MLEIFVTSFMAFVIAYLAMPVVITIADKKNLYDLPDERKLHTKPIASLGGIGIFLAVVFSCLVGISFSNESNFQYYFAAIFIMFAIGLKDDIIALSATKKFVSQIIAAAIIVHLGGIHIDNLYGIAGIEALPDTLGIPLTYVTIILIINAYNLIDGIDGLAGSLGLLSGVVFGTYFYFAGMVDYAAFSFALSAALLAFLIFNFNPAKLFMGDSGSLTIGVIMALLVLKFITVAGNPGSALPVESAVAIGIAIIIIPLVDTLRVFTVRMAKGRSPFSPERNHLHHLLLDQGMNHNGVVLTCITANLVLIGLAYTLRFLGNFTLIVALFSISFLSLGILYFSITHRKKVIRRRFVTEQKQKLHTKIIRLDTKEQVLTENANLNSTFK